MQHDVKSNTSFIGTQFSLDKVKDVLVVRDGELCPFTKRDPMVLVNGKEYPSVVDFIQSEAGEGLFVGMKHMMCQHIYLQRLFDCPEVRFYFEGYDTHFVNELKACFQKLHEELRTYTDEEICAFLSDDPKDIQEFKMIQRFVGRQDAIQEICDQKASMNDSISGLSTSEDMPSPST
jgi:hypothetical protein